MIKFKTLEFKGLSHRILGKIENAVNHLEISALVPEIFQFEKISVQMRGPMTSFAQLN